LWKRAFWLSRSSLHGRLAFAVARQIRTTDEAIKDSLTRIRLVFRGFAGRDPPKRSKSCGLRILMVDDLVPDPLFGAGYPRAAAIVDVLVKAGHRLTFYPMESTHADIIKMETKFGSAVTFHAGGGQRGLRRLLWTSGDTYDLLFISRPSPMRAFAAASWQSGRGLPSPVIIYDAEAINSPREARRRALFGEPWSEQDQQAALVVELEPAQHVDIVTVVSTLDAAVVQSILDKPVFILPHSVQIEPGRAAFEDRKDLLFVGRLTGSTSHSPNVNTVHWFVTQVMPLLDATLGNDYKLHVAGLLDAPEVEALSSDRVILHGVVHDLNVLYDSCRVFVTPTRFAAGISLKVIEAMGRGLPCVVTPLLAEQLAVSSDALPCGTSAAEVAEQCRRLYLDPQLWRSVRDKALEIAAQSYSQENFNRTLLDLVTNYLQKLPAAQPERSRARL
jgi:glycosyltransferase involved in cell wall biosynthesis